MKLNETIELNGKEYTVELNRESILKIDQYTNFKSADEKLNKSVLKDKSEKEISEDEDPFAESISEEKLEKEAETRKETIKKMIIRAFWIWLYPQEKLSISQVEDILAPYFEEDEKAEEISKMYEDLSEKSIDIRKQYLDERKNLKALAK